MLRFITKSGITPVFTLLVISIPLSRATALTARTDAESTNTAEGRWAGVRVSDAYAYAECPNCEFQNEIKAGQCKQCGSPLPQPSPAMTDPSYVFVPGHGYFREGSLVEPAKSQKGYWVTGGVLITAGAITALASYIAMGGYYQEDWFYLAGLPSLAGIAVGGVLFVVGFATRTGPVYAFASGGRFDPYERPAFALRSADSNGAALKVELTVLGF
jgi:hypothetical protein